MSPPVRRFVLRLELARQAIWAARFRALARLVALPPRCERLMRRPFGQSRDNYRRGAAGAIRMKGVKPVTSCDELFIRLTGHTGPRRKTAHYFLLREGSPE